MSVTHLIASSALFTSIAMLIASNLLPKKFINNRVIGSCHYIEKVMKKARLPTRPFNDPNEHDVGR